ncbi:GEVED domain-containing protein [Flavobacterium sp.]|uniref:T9SS type A sorting domain-containing protein n=1 Tax=Flavobacterium sp. TaxID=239 RepID=UPI00122A78EE|nr:GEVED domain-containing protein [Flavobacterium sp.]RZJ73060.1 MAG: T9SS type A sorting domain-containing protein [Flavobacterium sp.]
MKLNFTPGRIKALAIAAFALQSGLAFAQIEYRKLDGFGNALLDINDSGKAIKKQGVYDFATDATQPIDAEAISLAGINNNGDLIGLLPWIVDGETYLQAGFKKNGVWTPIGYLAGATVDASVVLGQISENGNYITGQMTSTCCDQQAFLYHVATSNLERIATAETHFSAGYSVNDSGIIGGWYDTEPAGGTLRVPAYMTTGSITTNVPDELPQFQNINQVSAVTNGNLMVGDRDGVPFIFDQTTGTFTAFEVPAGYFNATFTSVSENGIAVGYCQAGFTRDAIVYHPSLGPQPILIAEILAANGIEITSFDGKLGTAISISPNGNYVSGWENGNINAADGWAIYFDDLLLGSCYIVCPQDIVLVSLDGPTVGNYTLNFNCSDNPDATIVLVSGPASGSLFPYGTTEVVHNLVAADGTVLNTCSFTVTVNDFYCIPTFESGEAITLVSVAGIVNASAADSTEAYEDFTAISGTVNIGSTYIATFEGNTGGEWTDFFTVYADWNQDGNFSEEERTDIGTISNSNGNDGVQISGELIVPADALTGTTTLRVIKTFDAPAENACNPGSDYGQVEDYTLNVEPALGTGDFTDAQFNFYPNPVKNILHISHTTSVKTVTVFNMLGQKLLSQDAGSTSVEIDLSALPSGHYLVKATSDNAVRTFKIAKN